MTTAADFEKKYDIVDSCTPKYSQLKGIYKRSFAYKRLRETFPTILTRLIDNLAKNKDELVVKYGEISREEIKSIVGLLSKLKYQLQTDKSFELFIGNEPDKDIWNKFIKTLTVENGTFYKSCWLYSECYIYRKIFSFFEASESLCRFDYFFKQKFNAMIKSINVMKNVAQYTRNLKKSREMFCHLLKINLWSNRFDLSFTDGSDVTISDNSFELINSLDSYILKNNSLDIWTCLNEAPNKDVIIEIVCDNAGFELFTDLLVADYLISHNLANKILINVKAIPWFISDVTSNDFHWTIQYLQKHESPILRELSTKWNNYLKCGKFELAPVDFFWTSPYEFNKMTNISPNLYVRLCKAHLIIFKGDLNYRKLLSDYAWNFTDKFEMCLQGFQPTNLCTLRTVKADLICGLSEGVAEDLFKIKSDWMITGEYGIIQFAKGMPCNI